MNSKINKPKMLVNRSAVTAQHRVDLKALAAAESALIAEAENKEQTAEKSRESRSARGPKALHRQRLGIAQPEDGAVEPLQKLKPVSERKAEEKKRRARPKQPIKPNGDGLYDWLTKHLNQAWSPKSARELVAAWYAHWRGRPDKPEGTIKANTTRHVDRTSKWLDRKVLKGEIAVYDNGGEWNARRYYKPDGVRLRQRGAPLSEISSDADV